MSVPIMNPLAQYESFVEELEAIAAAVIRSGQFILGPNVKAFEAEAAEYLGVKHAIGVANGTDALVLALRALGIGPGDEVICPAYTFYATGEAIAAAGATPVFADVDAVTYTLDVDSARARINGATKAIMPVHLFGQCADMDALSGLAEERGLHVIEDAAQAWGSTYKGARAGSFGDAATFSFFPTKNLPCFGDGGLVATNDDDVAERVRMLRFHGSKDKKVFEYVGCNSRLDELQAAILRRLLTEVDGWNESRARVAAAYADAGLGDLVALPAVADGRNHIYHVFGVGSEHRAEIAAGLKAAGVGCNIYYDPASHLQPVFEHLGYVEGDLPVTDRLSRELLAIPMFPTMTDEQIATVVESVRASLPVAAAR